MKLYEFCGGELNGKMLTEEQAKEVFCYKGSGMSMDWSNERELGFVVPRKELDNEMEFRGYVGPMWNGDGHLVNGTFKWMNNCDEGDKLNTYCYVLRYETQEVYDYLSR